MNENTDSTATEPTPAVQDTHPAGDIQLRRPVTAGLRVALLLGVTAIAAAETVPWTTVSVPGMGA